MIIDAADLEAALRNKGFKLERSTNDKIFYFYYQGKKTKIHTKISLGRGEDLRDKLAGKIKRQMYLDTSAQLRDFVACTLSETAYIEHLRAKNELD